MIRGDGPALVAVYGDGRREVCLYHEHDGGEAYMLPVIKRGIHYAKSHYDSGNIVDVLMSEPEMEAIKDDVAIRRAVTGIRHAYYLTYTNNTATGKKLYGLRAMHYGSAGCADLCPFPCDASMIPDEATVLL